MKWNFDQIHLVLIQVRRELAKQRIKRDGGGRHSYECHPTFSLPHLGGHRGGLFTAESGLDPPPHQEVCSTDPLSLRLNPGLVGREEADSMVPNLLHFLSVKRAHLSAQKHGKMKTQASHFLQANVGWRSSADRLVW